MHPNLTQLQTRVVQQLQGFPPACAFCSPSGREALIIAVVLILVDVVLVNHVHAHNKMAASHQTPAPPMSTLGMVAEQFYPVMIVTTAKPLQIPGRVLEPGQYTFQLIDSDREVLVSKVDGSESYGTYLVLPAWRRVDTGGLVDMANMPAGAPDHIVSWYFPEQHDGYAFRY